MIRIGIRAGLGAVVLLAAMPVHGESPRSHGRQPQRYEAPPLVLPAAEKERKPPPPRNPFGDTPDERRGGVAPIERIKKPSLDDGKREMIGEQRLWNTYDPAGKRGVFAFLGNKIGDPIEKMFPDPQEKGQFGALLCSGTPGMPGWLECTDDSMREMVNGTWTLLYRGVEISFVNYRYLDGKLVGFRMGFPTANFEKLGEVLRKQYGPPTSEEETSWQHRLGGVYDIKIRAWNTPVGEMSLRSRGAALDAGILALIEPKAEARYDDMRFRQVVMPPRPAVLSDDGFVIHPLPGKPEPDGATPAGKAPVE